MNARKMIVLDRDGVLNQMIIDQEHGTIDSPLHPDQVELCPGVEEAIRKLDAAGYTLVIATNQPAARKGKTTKENLEAVHEAVLEQLGELRNKIVHSYISPYLREDKHPDRKPGTGMLEKANQDHEMDRAQSWMVGDGATDVQCGKSFGLKTAFIGPRITPVLSILEKEAAIPDLWCESLLDFSKKLEELNLNGLEQKGSS